MDGFVRKIILDPTSLTNKQRSSIRILAKKYNKDEISKRIGTSPATVQRFCRFHKISMRHFVFADQPELRQKILDYYITHGKIKTQKRFPNIKVRSIIETYSHVSRQTRWKPDEILLCVRMAGLFLHKDQARYLNRPNAYAGSIRTLFTKRIKTKAKILNILGRPHVIKIKRTQGIRYMRDHWGRRFVLWNNLEKQIRPENDIVIKKCIRSMAKFQRWIWGTKNVRKEYYKLKREVENVKRTYRSRSTIQYTKCRNNFGKTNEQGN